MLNVQSPKGGSCENRCGGDILFNLGDQSSNRCKFFDPSEVARKAREAFKLYKVDWLCGSGHIVTVWLRAKQILVICVAKHSMRDLRSLSQLG